MPALSKARWENFARNLSRGMTQADAYEQAGFKRDDNNASRLARHAVIMERVEEIKAEREQILSGPNAFDPDGDDGGEQIAITSQWVLERLASNVIAAQASGNHSAANKALEMLGQHLGMSFADKTAPAKSAENDTSLGTGNTFNILQMTDALAAHTAQLAGPQIIDVTPKEGNQ